MCIRDRAPIDVVEPGYFQTLRIPLLRGRAFSSGDLESAPRVAVVNETMARHFWSGKNPIGARVRFFGENTPVEIVGMVKDSINSGLGEPPRPMIYLCLRLSLIHIWSAHCRPTAKWSRSSGRRYAWIRPGW